MEDLHEFNDGLGVNQMVAGVYATNPDPRMKTLQVRRDWFDKYAKLQ